MGFIGSIDVSNGINKSVIWYKQSLKPNMGYTSNLY